MSDTQRSEIQLQDHRPTDWTPSSFGEDVTMQKRRTASRATAPKLPQASHGKGRGKADWPHMGRLSMEERQWLQDANNLQACTDEPERRQLNYI
ncbi:MAG: hypothetical protein FRX49_05091 [Trebouxia sp. A1-2]|nr:MAG: hypothetical protein FRX49_05091 [Trebouxia sp. A1-2]